jgi:serine/threonine protein kinase/Tol biopolymer transport system component
MTPDDWRRVKAIAGEAWSLPPAERLPYIASACEEDEGLTREVSSLVEAMAAAEERFEVPPPLPGDDSGAPGNLTGLRVGAYEILSRIAAGGMGEVYKARDTRLDRIVAIKALPAGTSADPVSRDRMDREARAVAALNHPHICTLHDLGSHDGIDYLVMEYLDGETLAARLSRGRLPIAEALQYADQIASALGEAHRAGIVHRDVKPANIMLDRKGLRSGETPHAKLLDFGVAKANPLEMPSGFGLPPSGAVLDLTLPGFVLGTVHYMAPEQLDRNAADVRTDIFALGAVLFEMLTGRKAFDGNDRAEVLAAIRYHEVPRVSSLRPGLPAAVDRMVLKCLARSPDDRYQSIQELVADLRLVRRRLDSSPRVRKLAVSAVLLAVAIAGTTAWLVLATPDAEPSSPPVVTRLAATAGVLGAPSLSPDGSTVVFSWAGDTIGNPELVFLRIGSLTKVRLTTDPGVEQWPAWSPDGSRIAFVRCGAGRCGIFSSPVAGGPELKIRDLRDDRYYGLAWLPDGGSIVFGERPSASEPYALFALSLDTRVTTRLTTPPAGFGDLRFAVSPDGSTLAVVRLSQGIGVHLVSLATGADTALLTGQQEWFGGIAWSTDGRHLILSANQQGARRLWKLPVAGGGLEQLAIAGEDSYFPSVSARGGRLAFVREFGDWDLSRMTLARGQLGSSAPFPSSTRIDLDPAFSPDGHRLAFVSERSGSREVWVSNADGTGASQLTSFRGPTAGRPSWSPDGRLLAFHANGIHVVAAGGGPSRRVTDDGEVPSWSADGRSIYFVRSGSSRFRVWKVPAAGGTAVQALVSDASVAHESTDGADIYFAGFKGGIWRRPVAGGEETPVVDEFDWSLIGYWTVFSDGICYVARESLPDRSVVNHVRFFDFSRRRTIGLGTLPGTIEDWVGGFTVSQDRRAVVHAQRTYQSSEVMLVDHFR